MVLVKWEKLDVDSKQKIIDTLPMYLSDTPDVKFRKHPITYLNQKVWEDYDSVTSLNSIDLSEARKRASVRYSNPTDEMVNTYMTEQGYTRKGKGWIVE